MRILVAVDGSKSADRATSLVANLAWPKGSTIEVVTAYPGHGGLLGRGAVKAAEEAAGADDAMAGEARRMAGDAAGKLSMPDVTVRTQVMSGRAASAIQDQAASLDADLIVIGDVGTGPFESAVLGSVAAEVIDHSSRPVLVVRRDRLDRVVLADDGSPTAAVATETIRGWSVLRGARIRVLSVADIDPQANAWLSWVAPSAALDATRAQAHQEHVAIAERTAAGLRAAGFQAESGALDGMPARQLVEAATAWDADLIVVGTHGQTALKRLLFGSVARTVLNHAPCSVLIVPGPHRQTSTATAIA